jgi:hypothetical protein
VISTLTRTLLLGALCAVSAAAAALPETQVLPLRLHQAGRFSAASSRAYVNVPAGVVQLVMEQRVSGEWRRIQVQEVTFAPRERSKSVFLNLPPKVPWNSLRIIARRSALPPMVTPTSRIYERYEDITESRYVTVGTLAPIMGGVLRQDNALAFNTAQFNHAVIAPSAPAAPAEEADIWKIAGGRLFFFNQFRGLQVFDLSNPAEPARLGGLRLPARGDQLYILDQAATTAALVGQPVRNGSASVLYIARLKRNAPELVAELSLPGWIVDSRLIGQQLYLLSHTQLPPTNQIVHFPMQSQCTLLTVDLANPAAPVLAAPLQLGPVNSSHLQASDRYLLIGASGNEGLMHVVDTQTSTGAPLLLKTVTLKAPVQDKFKMGVVNGAAVAVSSRGAFTTQETWVETFPIAGDSVQPLAQLELRGARGEVLYASRFDGDRLYVVTFMVRIARDPLFIIDLADPAAPAVRAALEIPGWSTYLEPHGDRILAVGREGNHVAVSLFDVGNAESPSLLSRLLLGQDQASSWSEASNNEKAAQYFPENETLLAPFSGVDSRTVMQVVKVGRDTLTAGLTIPQDGTARRGAVVGQHFVSISGSELRVLDSAATTATPVAEVSLAWRVDRVLSFGSHLVQIEDGSGWGFDGQYNGRRCIVRVSRLTDPDALLEELDLGEGRIIGAAQRANRLYLAQWLPNGTQGGENGPRLATWILDASKPAQVRLAATVHHSLDETGAANFDLERVEALWPNPTTLVWHLPVTQEWLQTPIMPDLWLRPMPITGTLEPVLITNASLSTNQLIFARAVSSPPPGSKLAVVLCPVDDAGAKPTAEAALQLQAEEPVRGNSRAVTHQGTVYLSYDAVGAPEAKADDNAVRMKRRIRSWLQAVSFQGAAPKAAAPVSIPGELLELTSHPGSGGLLVYSRAGARSASVMDLHASSVEGAAATLLRTKEVAANVQGAYAASEAGTLYFVGAAAKPVVVGWKFDAATTAFVEVAAWQVSQTPRVLKALPKLLLAGSVETMETARVGPTGALIPAAAFDTPPGLTLRVDRLIENAAGAFIPALDYGVEFLPWKQLEGK